MCVRKTSNALSPTNIRLIYERIRNYGRKNPLPAAQEEVVRDDRERREALIYKEEGNVNNKVFC